MNFDLNTQNYNKSELEEIFELPPNYGPDLVEMKETKLRQTIVSDKTVDETTKKKTVFFLAEAKKILMGANMAAISQNGHNVNNGTNQFDNYFNLDTTLQKASIVQNSRDATTIEHKAFPYLKASSEEIFHGKFNPLEKNINRKNLNIDTRFRDNYNNTKSSNFHLDLPLKLSDVVSMQLTALELPTTFYNISKVFGNNFFNITIEDETRQIIIPEGNYTSEAFVTLLNNYVTKWFTDSNFQYIHFKLDIHNSSGSGRLIVELLNSVPEPFHFTLNFKADIHGNEDAYNPLQLKLGWLMGFRSGYYCDDCSYTSEGLVDLVGIRYLYFVIDEYTNNTLDGFYGAFTKSILNKNILARISLNGGAFESLSQNNLGLITYPRNYYGPIDIQKMNIQLLDEYGRVIDMNNMDYSFCLTFKCIYNI